MVWDVLSGEFKVERSIECGKCSCFVLVKNGILFIIRNSVFELWNFELIECICRWFNLCFIKEMMFILEKWVVCVGKENDVNVLDIISLDVVLILFFYEGYELIILMLEREVIVYNSRCYLLFMDCYLV